MEPLDLTAPINAKIVKIEFTDKPESSYLLLDKSSNYSCDQGAIRLRLNNGLVLEFWNSEWGGMRIIRQENIPKNKIYMDYTKEDIDDKL